MQDVARHIRGRVIQMSAAGRAPHLGSALSCVDILVAAYWGAMKINPDDPDAPDRDRLVFSKGHAISALYAALAFRGLFDPAMLDQFNVPGSALPEHPSPRCVPGLEVASGSLGHGLSIGAGMALAGRIAGRDYRVFVVASDGECNEGSVWEAAMFAAGQHLDHLAVIVDFNRWQATGRSTEVLALEPLRDKFEAFGFSAVEVNGHDLTDLAQHLSNVPDGSGKPIGLIAHTVKGKGVSFMEDDNNWHYRIPTGDEVAAAHAELGL